MTESIKYPAFGHIVISIMPVGMFLFNKSAPAILVTAAVFTFAQQRLLPSAVKSTGPSKPYFDRQIIISSILLIIYFLISLSWSPNIPRSLDILAGAAITLIAGAAILSIESGQGHFGTQRFAFIVLTIVSIAIILEQISGMQFHKLANLRSEPFALKRTVLCNALIFIGLLRWSLRHYGPSRVVFAGAVQLGAIAAAHSGAALCGALGLIGSFVLARVCGLRRAKVMLLALIAGAFIFAPFLGTSFYSIRNGPVVHALHDFHLKERIEIWNAFDILVRNHPFIGYGFGSSQELVGHAERHFGFDPTLSIAKDIHPHNGYLQIWVEAGGIGAVIALIAIVLLIVSLPSEGASFSIGFGILAFCCFVMLLSHSLWQPWWIASVAAALVWKRSDSLVQ